MSQGARNLFTMPLMHFSLCPVEAKLKNIIYQLAHL